MRGSPPARRVSFRNVVGLSLASLAAGTGIAIISVVYLFMRFIPQYRIDARPAMTGPAPGGSVAAAPTLAISNSDQLLQTLLVTSLVALVVMVVVSAAVGRVIASRITRPLTDIAAAARLAAGGAYGHRLAQEGVDDEIGVLSTAFDQMLEAVEHTVEAHRRFAANASHELRTPLAITQTLIDVSLREADSTPEQLRSVLRQVRTTNRSNVEIVDALLDLAEVEGGSAQAHPTDLAIAVREAIAAVEAESSAAGLTITSSIEPVVASLDPTLWRLTTSNLMLNAVRHNVVGGTVDVVLAKCEEGQTGRALLTLSNSGHGVPADVLPSLLEPFVRAGGRLRADRGHGLGLAIVDACVRVNGGAMDLRRNSQGGLTVTLHV